jgi:alkylation response protein AidB-like acyl-CoA dehydrogenase
VRAATLEAARKRLDSIGEVIRDHATESERLGRLAPPVVDSLHETELFRVLVPADCGGDGLTIPDATELIERAATFDASTAWAYAILADGAIFTRFLSREARDEIFGDPAGLLAGTLNPATARAERVDGGYVFSGTATYLSGSAHAEWVMAAALVTENGEVALDDGLFSIRNGVFPIEQARNLETWSVTGMRATGSNDYAFDGVEVPAAWTFDPFDRRSSEPVDPFSCIPLWAQLGGGLAAVAVGTAANMIERFCELASTKVPTGGNFSRLAERAPAQIAVGEAVGLQLAAHAALRQSVDSTWQQGVDQRPFTDVDLARHRLGTVTAVRLAAQAIDLLHDAAGMNAVAADGVLDRCWRDVHTMTQHIILGPARYEIGGRVVLGLDPGSPVI